MKEYNLKKILGQLDQWCVSNNISVQSVYDDCHGMTLQEIVYYLLGVVKEAANQVVNNTDAFQELYNFVHDYFDNLNVQNEINNKIDEMASDGTLTALFGVYNDKRYVEITLPTTRDLDLTMVPNNSWVRENGFKYIGGGENLYSEQYFNADTRYLVSFETDRNINGEWFTVKIGDTETIVVYNGKTSFEFGLKTLSGGRLTIEPLNESLNGISFNNFTIKQILSASEANFVVLSDDGTIKREEERYKIGGYFYGLNNGMFAFDQNSLSIGNDSCTELTTGVFNTVIGNNNLVKGNVATRNTIVGCSNMVKDRVGDRNTILGTFIANGENYSRNVFIGSDSASTANNVQRSVFIGCAAGYSAAAHDSVIIGNSAGYYGGDENVVIGGTTGTQLEGKDNVIIGYRCALDANSNECVYIGAKIKEKSKTGNGYVNINDLIAGNKEGYIQVGKAEEIYFGNVGYDNKGIMYINRNGNGSFVCAQNSDNMGGYTIHDINANKNAVELKCRREGTNYELQLNCNNSAVLTTENGTLRLPTKPSLSPSSKVGCIAFTGDELQIMTNSGVKTIKFNE